MSVLGLNSKDRNSTRDKANISNPKVNRGSAYSQPTTSQQTVCKFHLDPQYHIFHWGSTILGDSTLWWAHSWCKAMKAIYIIYLHGATSIPLWISNHMLNKVWDEINHLFTNFNDCTFQIWKWINNFNPHFIMDIYLSSLQGEPGKNYFSYRFMFNF